MFNRKPRALTTQLAQDVNGRWFVRLKGANGEIVATTETYSNKSGAKRAAKRLAPQMERQRGRDV